MCLIMRELIKALYTLKHKSNQINIVARLRGKQCKPKLYDLTNSRTGLSIT